MKTFDESYIKTLKNVLNDGVLKHNRTGVDTISSFNCGGVSCIDDSEGWHSIPLSNLRKIYWKGALIETLWIMGIHMYDECYSKFPRTNIKYLVDNNVNYWTMWSDENGNLGSVYGQQLTAWNNSINQIERIINTLRHSPDDRRLVASMWNPSELSKMALPPCHYAIEFYSRPTENGKRYLDTKWIQRSCDIPIGVPYDVLIYSFMNKIISCCTNHIPGRVYASFGDCHVYVNQMDGAKELVRRWDSKEVLNCPTPRLTISDRIMDIIYKNKYCELSDFSIDGSDFSVDNYLPMEHINIKVTK